MSSIGLANLTINVNANVASVVNEMAAVKASTHASMTGSSASVNEFQRSVGRDSAAVQAHARAMGAGMDKSSADIAKSAKESADSIAGIESTADATVASIKSLSREMDAAGAGLKKAIGPEAAENLKTTTDRVEEFAASRLAIAAVGLAFGAVAGTVAAVGYAAYKASGFMAGLITGDSYKSANIDALITETDKIKALQKELEIAAIDASALDDALARLGVNKADIISVKGAANKALGSDENSELDRLGVAWKGKDPTTLIQNAVKALDEYTEGWDRNAAAVSMGLGSYEQMTNYLKVNQVEVERSKERLNDFGLGIGADTEAAVERYQSAMRLFNNETKLMGDGFKRVISDNTMPILTNFAGYLTEGWPSAVNFFRGVTASFSTILIGLDSAAYIAVKSTIATLTALYEETVGVVKALAKLAQGDTAGAYSALVDGHKSAEKAMAESGTAMVEHSKNTVAAIKQAWAFDDRTNPLGMKPKKGKSFKAKPDDPDDPEVVTEKDDTSMWAHVHSKYLEYLKSFNATRAELVKTGAAEQQQINQHAFDWGLISQKQYLDRKHELAEKALSDEIAIKKQELNTLAGQVYDAFGDKSAKGALAYTEALKKEQDAKRELVALEGKLTVAKAQNADESEKLTVEQTAQYADLTVQILELTGRYEEAAKARRDLEQSDPKFKALPQQIQDAKNSLSAGAIARGRAQDVQNNITDPARRLQGAIGGDNYGSKFGASDAAFAEEKSRLQAQYDAKLLLESEFNAKMLQAKQQYAAEQSSIGMSMAEDSIGIMKQAFADNKAMSILALAAEAAIAVARIMMNAEVAKSAAIATAQMAGPLAPAMEAAAIARITAGEMMSVGMVGASTAMSAMQIAGRRAGGGPVRGGETYLVGEKGPELFTAGSTGHITPNNQLGGASVTQHITIDARGADQGVEQRIHAAMTQAKEQAKAEIFNDMNRGGKFAMASGRIR